MLNQNSEQNKLEQIRLGLENNVDVSIYAKPEYTWEQMNEIRYGLVINVDILFYAKKEFSCQKMQQIRWGLQKKLRCNQSMLNQIINGGKWKQ